MDVLTWIGANMNYELKRLLEDLIDLVDVSNAGELVLRGGDSPTSLVEWQFCYLQPEFSKQRPHLKIRYETLNGSKAAENFQLT